MSDQGWKRIEPTKVTKVGYRTIVSKTFALPDGTSATFDIVDPDGSRVAAIIALTPDNRVIIARQFRTGPEKIMDELPGGFVEPGEEPELAARREFAEETGYKIGDLEFLGIARMDAYTNTTRHYYLATGCTPDAEQRLEAHEFIELRLISIDELLENARTGLMTDAVAVVMAYDKLERLRTA